jgi:hypothetical protein
MHIRCPACQQTVPLADIDLGTRLAKCVPCGQVFSFADQVGRAGQGVGRAGVADGLAPVAPAERPRFPQPVRLNVADEGDTLRISFRWFHPAILFLVFFCVAWDGFLFFWYSIAVGGLFGNDGPGMPGAFKWLFVIFPLGHVAVGIGLTYTCLASLLNRTVITVDREWLTVRHGPLFWPGQCTVAVEEIDQLYCRQQFSVRKNGPTQYHPHMRNAGAVTASLMIVTKDGRERPLWRYESDRNVVLFLEQRIEEHLGIADRRVGGEMTEY